MWKIWISAIHARGARAQRDDVIKMKEMSFVL